MNDSVQAHLHGGPLDGTVRPAPVETDGRPAELIEFDHRGDGGIWYVEYRRVRDSDQGWHFEATGNEERADEE